MPLKNKEASVKAYVRRYGYQFAKGFHYTNNYTKMKLINMRTGQEEQITDKTFRNRVKAGTITKYIPQKNQQEAEPHSGSELAHEPEFPFNDMQLGSEIRFKSSYEKWLEKQDAYIKGLDEYEQNEMYNNIQDYVKQLMRKHNFTIYDANTDVAIKALTEAFKIVMPRLGSYNVLLTFHSKDGPLYYKILS